MRLKLLLDADCIRVLIICSGLVLCIPHLVLIVASRGDMLLKEIILQMLMLMTQCRSNLRRSLRMAIFLCPLAVILLRR